MSEQSHVKGGNASNIDHEEPAQIGKKINTSDTDELLDEIDLVLEKNAAEFIKGFVQKGGQ